MAAGRTVEGRVCHSFHAYFLRAGDPKVPIFTRWIAPATARASRRGALSPSSMGGRYSISQRRFRLKRKAMNTSSTCLAFLRRKRWSTNTRYGCAISTSCRRRRANGPCDRAQSKFGPWSRAVSPIAESIRPMTISGSKRPGRCRTMSSWQQAVLAYASDMSLLDTALLPHGVDWQSAIQMASLDHAMWFHHRFHVDDWLLYVQESPSASGARGFNRGAIYARNGSLVASVVQEGLMRPRPSES